MNESHSGADESSKRADQPSSSSEITEAIDDIRDALNVAVDRKALSRLSRLESLYLEQLQGFEEAVQERVAAARTQWEDEGWPFEWVVATALREKLKASGATVREQLQEIERLRAFEGPDYQYAGNHIPRAAIECRNEEIRELYARLSSLKDSQLTPEEARVLLVYLDNKAHSLPIPQQAEYAELGRSADAKLRALSTKGTAE